MQCKTLDRTFRIACLLITTLLTAHYSIAQDNIAQKINDEWFRDIGMRGLKIGDTVPDIDLGIVMNNKTGATKFSQLKGKLIILDFWNTSCAACIAKFPYMERLQKDFNDQIQVFLVNPYETRQQVESRFINYKGKGKKMVLPDLPVIVSNRPYVAQTVISSPMFQLFPHREVPHHAWVDKNGVVRMIGGSENTYPSKIKDLIDGKEIFVLSNASTVPRLMYGENRTYYKLLGDMKRTGVRFGSFITGYNNELNGGPKEFTDTLENAWISQFINQDLLEIYAYGPFKRQAREMNAEIIYAPIIMRWQNFVIFSEGVDTSKYISSSFIAGNMKSDKEIVESGYCYEIVVPLNMDEGRRSQKMLNDLNTYFEDYLGVTAKIEEREINYYGLARTSILDKISASYDTYSSLRTVIEEAVQNNDVLSNQMLRNKFESKPYLVINETGWDIEKQVVIKLAKRNYDSIDELNEVLQLYDLKLVERKGKFNFFVFIKTK